MNHQGLRWNVHCVANVGLRVWLNLYKHGFKIYDLVELIFGKKKMPLSRRVEYVMDGSMDESVSQ